MSINRSKRIHPTSVSSAKDNAPNLETMIEEILEIIKDI